jgi:C1A family cysteine protease
LALIGAAFLLSQPQGSKVSQFEAWKTQHSIHYPSEIENIYREKIFLKNLAEIEAHNAQNGNTYEMGLNQFSAMTHEEFAEIYLNLIVDTEATMRDSVDDVRGADIDWVSAGAVTDIKNQGQCGSCWAFSTTGSLEGLSKLADGSLQSFSEQYLVDCDYSILGNRGCDGGLMDNAFKHVKKNGIPLENEYRNYTAKRETCDKTVKKDFKIKGYVDIKDCTSLANALTGRPISIAVDATNWHKYGTGIFNDCKTGLNHGVLLVGATDASWVVKNSWGTSWGEKGYIRLTRGNTCGLCNQASYPTK